MTDLPDGSPEPLKETPEHPAEDVVGPQRWLKRALWTAGVLFVFSGLGVAAGYYAYVAPGPHKVDKVVLVPWGASLQQTAAGLQERRVVQHRYLFTAAALLRGDARRLKAGEYQIPAGANLRDVLDIIRSGETVQHFVTFSEGLTNAQIQKKLLNQDLLTGPLAVMPPEGTLLPETYSYSYNEPRTEVVARMQQHMDKVVQSLWPARASDLPFDTVDEALTLASIVEKETGVAAERPLVASVFVNRLKKGMKLQSDATVVYGITGGFPLGRKVKAADLKTDTPYNTYKYEGLPPTPVANPGRASIAAVLNPAVTNYLYFVADGKGGHIFAETYAQHRRNVATFRRELRRQRQSKN